MHSWSLALAFGLFSGVYAHVVAPRDPQSSTAASINVPTYASIDAASALGAKIGPSGYCTEDFGGGAYMVTDGSYQSLVLVSNDGVIVVDAPPSIGHKLLYAIGNITNASVTHLVYTHNHADHIGGAAIFDPAVEIVAHYETAQLLAQVNDTNRPPPTQTFHTSHTIGCGNQTLRLEYKGENHIRGNIFVYAPKQKVLMLVDVIFPGWVPFSQLGEAKNVPGFILAHDQVLAYDFKHFVGGHLERSGNRQDVLVQKEFMNDLFTNCKYAIDQSATNNPILGAGPLLAAVSGKDSGNPWALFKVYLDLVVGYCSNTTNEKWLNRLAGADIFDTDNAMTMIESLRIDYGVLGPFQLQ